MGLFPIQVAYRQDRDVRKFIRKTAALAFVPPRFVRIGWQALKANAPMLSAIPQFIDYFESTWLVGNFDIRLWNVHDSSTIRTNNHVEGWHSRLNKIVGKAHPNIFELVDTFKKEQATTEIDVTQRAVGAAPPRRSRQAVERQKNKGTKGTISAE